MNHLKSFNNFINEFNTYLNDKKPLIEYPANLNVTNDVGLISNIMHLQNKLDKAFKIKKYTVEELDVMTKDELHQVLSELTNVTTASKSKTVVNHTTDVVK